MNATMMLVLFLGVLLLAIWLSPIIKELTTRGIASVLAVFFVGILAIVYIISTDNSATPFNGKIKTNMPLVKTKPIPPDSPTLDDVSFLPQTGEVIKEMNKQIEGFEKEGDDE